MKQRPLSLLEWIILLLITSAGVAFLAYDKLHEERTKPTFIQQEIFKK